MSIPIPQELVFGLLLDPGRFLPHLRNLLESASGTSTLPFTASPAMSSHISRLSPQYSDSSTQTDFPTSEAYTSPNLGLVPIDHLSKVGCVYSGPTIGQGNI